MTGNVQLSELRVSASMDASGFAKGANDVSAAASKAGAATKGLGDAIVQTETHTRKSVDAFERLKRAHIDGYGTAQRFEAQLAVLNRGLDRGKISAEEAEKALIGLHRQYGLTADSAALTAKGQHVLAAAADKVNATIARTPALVRAANDNAAQFRRQNLGMQLGDTAQSLALGAPLSMVALQQGPQIAQLYMAQGGLNQAMRDFGVILGGVARVAGPVIAAVGALYGGYKLLESFSVSAGLAISDTTRELAAQAAPLGTVSGMVSELEKLQEQYNKTIANSGRASDTATSLILANTKMEYDARKQLLALELELQEARLATQRADMAIAGQSMRERVASQLSNDPSRAVREGYADPAINGGLPFVRVPDEISGVQKALDAVSTDPANRELAKMRAEAALTTLEINKMREALAKPFDTSGDPLASGYWDRYSQAQFAKQKAQHDLYNPAPDISTVPIPGMRPIDGGDPTAEEARIQKRIDLLHKEAGARRDIAALVTAGAKFDEGQQNEIAALEQRARVIGMNADAAARSNAIFQAEQQMRQAGLSTIGAEADARRNLAAATAEYANAVQRSEQAYQSWQTAGSSAIDALTASTGSLQDRLKGMADAMLKWVTEMALANPLKNALFGTNLPTLADLGKPAAPAGLQSTATMTVSAGVVNVTGGFPSVPGTVPGTTTGGLLDVLKGTTPAAKNPALAGLMNDPSLAARSTVPTPTGSIEDYIRSSAIQRGIDPNIAVRVAQSEGGLQSWNMQSQVIKNGIQEPSYGPFQLLKGGSNTGFPTGLGNDFVNQTGLDPALAANGPQGVDFALDYASKNGWGAWYGARAAGISKWQGIGTNPGVDNTTTNSISSSMQKFTQSTNSAVKGINTLGDSSQSVSTTLTDSLGKLATPAAVPAVPAVTPTAPAASGGGIFSSLFGGIFRLLGFADGTDFAPGGMAIVGERGKELVSLPRGSQVIPNHKLQGANSEERMRGRIVRHDYSITIAGNGDKELLERVRKAADESVAYGLRAYNDNVLANRVQEIAENPWDRG